MSKQTIKLTESEFKEIVYQTINEALEDEGFFGGLGALGSKAKNSVERAGKSAASTMSNAFNRTRQAVSNAYDQGKEKVSNAYHQAKKTYQAGSANQDAQKAINNAVNALNNLLSADEKLQSNGMNSVIGNKGQRQAIDNCIKALTGGGFTNIGQRFQNNMNAFTR